MVNLVVSKLDVVEEGGLVQVHQPAVVVHLLYKCMQYRTICYPAKFSSSAIFHCQDCLISCSQLCHQLFSLP